MRLVRRTVASLGCRPLRDLCCTVLVVAAASALLTYHLSRQLPPPTTTRGVDDPAGTARQRHRRRADRPDAAGDPVDVRLVLEGLDMEDHLRDPTPNVEIGVDNHDDDVDSADNEVINANCRRSVATN